MAGEVTFEEENTENRVGNIRIVPGEPTGMLAWLIKNDIAKDGKSAERLLLIAAVVIVIAAIGVFYFFGINHASPAPPGTLVPGPNGTLVPIQ